MSNKSPGKMRDRKDRSLASWAQKEEYPLPRIDDIFVKLAEEQRFTKINLKQAYHQMEVEEESQEYLTINTHQGLYRYNGLVFGITSAPAIW
ncbi:Uncharacterized protein P5673_019758 [Acropora cervicornis]|uniref:Reverse transcriptase domain-containing protein n=1 Tax=Acropora cervicornis TaxID=6130 RepID=A0AAD9QBH1_ACRCE|nr:Uncharacterized protein P5673_019758 [Acropora cervicornis]